MENEIWKFIPGYDNKYMISNIGRVKSMARTLEKSVNGRTIKETIMTPHIVHGYVKINLYKNAKSSIFYLHRLLAQIFIPNPLNKPCVNHINGVRGDNRIENLEWCTYSENVRHAIRTGLKPPPPGTCHMLINTITKERKTTKQVAEELNRDRSYISAMMRGVYRNTTNYIRAL